MQTGVDLLRPDERATLLLHGLYERYGYKVFRMKRFEEYDFYALHRDFLSSGQILTFTGLDGKAHGAAAGRDAEHGRMMRMYERGTWTEEDLAALSAEQSAEVDAQVAAILADVRENGDEALRRYTERFDGASLRALKMPAEAIDAAYDAEDPDFMKTLEMAAENIRAFHRRQERNSFVIAEQEDAVLGQKVMPLARVGLYVPGGTAAYLSTVLMDALPAKIAGVEEIVIVTPPDKKGGVHPAVLAAAKVAGVARVFCVGGAQAIAALAYGTKSVPRVDKIVGLGNIFVATAKRRCTRAIVETRERTIRALQARGFTVLDLAYHILVLMAEMGVAPDDIRGELARRHVVDRKVKQETMR